jgi:very-short-patch-repair endonuclease
MTGNSTPIRFTKAQLKLEKLINAAGFRVVLEEVFPPYIIDCYCIDDHVAFEADGKPYHHKKADKTRDDYLINIYKLPVKRFDDRDIMSKAKEEEIKNEIKEFIESNGGGKDTRRSRFFL